MSHLHVKYLLLGGGLASGAAAQAIRQRDPDGLMLMVGQEIYRPYHRPALSKEFLRGLKRQDELFTVPEGWFSANHVTLRTAVRASRLDTARGIVMLDSGQEVSFDSALIATGASPRHLNVPGAELPNVYYLRNFADADRLHHAIEKARREGRPHAVAEGMPRRFGKACVVGGGLLGVEMAATLTQMGLSVDLVVPAPHPWAKYAGENIGRLITRHLQQHNVHVYCNAQPIRFEGDGRVQHIVLGDAQTLHCDFVVGAVGAAANKDLLRSTPINAEKAILVDDHLRTNVSNIFAAGDCCAVFDPLFNKHRIIDHWDNAVVTGTLAGANMAGADERYRAVNYFFSEVFDLSLVAWGEARLVERRLVRGPQAGAADAAPARMIEFGVAADGRIAQVLAIGYPDDADTLRQFVARRASVQGREDLLRDPDANLASLL